ncbi:GNAT family N-acetyltransferase [Gordonia sp. VNK21]|uniref:GNAT family N-acetyltransferase n=1 Tax=Gordonia sp. VNK21 TaxID=3382483 RepID=UPI0038D472FC
MPPAPSPARVRPRILQRGETALVLITSLLFTAATLTWSYRVKALCTGGPFHPDGRSFNFPVGDPQQIIPCYSDIVLLWVGRDIDNHVFPYIHGGINEQGHLFGGVVEYPVLSGLMMWAGAIGAHNDQQFFNHTVLMLIPFAVAITVMLALLTRWWVLLWAATPPLVLYAFHNWELPVVFTAVAAVAVLAYGGSVHPATGRRRWSLRTSSIIASVLLAIGFSLKIYPGLFVVPLALYVLTGGSPSEATLAALRAGRRRVLDWAGAAWVVAAAVLTTLVIQVPFMIAGYQGWRAALEFQGQRKADLDTNSFWYWSLRLLMNRDTYNTVVGVLSPLLIAVSLLTALYLAWRRMGVIGRFPWIGASFAMLSGFMLFHKVHSPQYTLWLLPFFAILAVPWPAVAAYLVTDTILDLTIFRLLGINTSGAPMKWWVISGVNLAVWVHVVLLAYFVIAGSRMALREPLGSYLRTALPGDGPLTRLAAADAARADAWLGRPVLSGYNVLLRPLEPADAQALGALAGDAHAEMSRWSPGVPAGTEEALAYIAAAAADPARVAFAVVDEQTGELVGTTSFYDVDAAEQTLAIGYTFYTPAAQGTRINPAAKLLLLDYAFTGCDAVRVVWHTHENNDRSRAAIGALGARFEGPLRKHRRFTGGWRTTAQFAMVDDDWPLARGDLESRVGTRSVRP